MAYRIGMLGVAHVHAGGYAWLLQNNPEVQFVGVWDHDKARAASFGYPTYDSPEDLIDASQALVIMSENIHHADLGVLSAGLGRHILCEKPLVTSEADGQRLIAAAKSAGVVLMVAFPCALAPSFARLKGRVAAGDIGKVLAVCATNHGQCPFGWFVDPKLSGGGAMIDHVVHVADLLHRLLGETACSVFAQTGNCVHGQAWEDTAMLTLKFPSGVFATLDSSWSRPKAYKTWGDVAMTVVGERV